MTWVMNDPESYRWSYTAPVMSRAVGSELHNGRIGALSLEPLKGGSF